MNLAPHIAAGDQFVKHAAETVEVGRLATHPRCKIEVSAIAITESR